MTDTSSVANTHSTTEPYPVTVPPPEPVLNGAGVDSAVPEEEPYTIRCVCTYDDDDGNTVFCERCETWQHIDCYYWMEDVPEIHVCEECFPRGIDRGSASERQRSLREQQSDGGGDRKSKRSGGAKGQRKKTNSSKDYADKLNGGSHHHQRSDSGARDQPPPKKTKTTHRTSHSISSLAGIPAFQPDGRKRAATSMSPTKSTGPSIPLYSKEFLHLYDQDQGHADMDSNLFVNLPLAADLASWVTDSTALSCVANGRSAQDIFTWADAGLGKSRWPALAVESVADPGVEIEGIRPTWKILKTQDKVGKDEIVGELTGKIGHLRDYCLDPSNRWQELRHPEPFVFFHPQLPLYIDSRHEGSVLRYVRRSCRPNVTMKTYITNEVEYHFCFVAKEDIPANAEITAMWYLDPQLFEATNGLVKQESNDNAQDIAAVCISNVLANYGGCACDPPSNCLLTNVDRRRHARGVSLDSRSIANGKRKKPKLKPTRSPSAPTSRAASEAAKHPDDDEADSRSASGSARGQAGSRDLTPTHDGASGFGESELSAREKRKIAAAEKKFQQLEQDQAAAHGRKKKRPSGLSTHPGPTGGGTSSGAGDTKSIFIDTTFVGRPSLSPPHSAISPSILPAGTRKASGPRPSSLRRAPYVDSAMQTDTDDTGADEVRTPTTPPQPSPRRTNFVPLTQRLLQRCQADWMRYEESNVNKRPPASSSPPDQSMPPPQSPASASATSGGRPLSQSTSPIISNQEKEDVDMKDPESPTANYSQRSRAPDTMDAEPSSPSALAKPSFPPPWPSTAAHNARIPPGRPANGHHASDLHVSLPPPPTFPSLPSLPSATSPGSAAPALSPQSTDAASQSIPGAGITAPSPVKKKLSLGDYLIRRGTMTTPTSEKSQSQANAMLPQSNQKSPPSQTSEGSPSQSKASSEENASEGGKPDGPNNSSDVTMQDAPDSSTLSNPPSVTF